MDHQASPICIAATLIKAFKSVAALDFISMFFCHFESSDRRAFAPAFITEHRLAHGAASSDSMHGVRPGNYHILIEIPHEKPWSS